MILPPCRGKKDLSLVQSLLGQEDVLAPPQGQRAAAEMPDGEADVVADHRRHESHQADQHDIELARAGVDRGGDQYGLTGHRDPEILDRDQEQDGPVTVVPEVGPHDVQEARQIRCRVAGQRGGNGC